MQKYAVVYTPRVKKKLIDFFELIMVGYANYFSAIATIDKIRKKCQYLATAPKACAVAMKIGGRDFRLARVKRYTIVYYIDEDSKTVHAMSVEYSRRDIESVIKKMA